VSFVIQLATAQERLEVSGTLEICGRVLAIEDMVDDEVA
jgi:hypothetical protein